MRETNEAIPTETMWKSKSREELDDEVKKRERRDKGLVKRSLLISEVPSDLKEEFSEHIIHSHKTSIVGEIWKRQHKPRYKSNGKPDTRKEMHEDWWNTPELISIAKQGIKADNKEKRNRKIKDFFYTYSGLKLLDNLSRKRKEDRANNEIAQEFLTDFYLNSFTQNRYSEMSEVLAEFLCFIYRRKGFRGIMNNEMAKNIAIDFIKQNNIKEVINPHNKTLLAFYNFWRNGDKIR